MIDYAASAEGRAMYLVAGQSGTHGMPYRASVSDRPNGMPKGLASLADLDFLDASNPLFHYNRGLFSAGQYLGRSGVQVPQGTFSRRPGVTILTDSGGLQFARGNAEWQGDASREWTLRFAEANGDEAIALDIPTLAIGVHPTFNTFQACLDTSVENARYWLDNRRGNTRFLAVLQGRDRKEATAWLRGAMAAPMDGWAVGGGMRADHVYLAQLFISLQTAGLLGRDRNRVHVLGDSSLVQAVMLSALQKSMRELLQDEDFLITFDTSSPTQMTARGFAYGYANLRPDNFSMTSFKPPSLNELAATDALFPLASSEIARRVTINDLASPSSNRQHGWDTLGNEIVTNHNIESLLRGIRDANSVLEAPEGWQDDSAPTCVIRAYNALRSMWQYPRDPIAHLRRESAAFKRRLALVDKLARGITDPLAVGDHSPTKPKLSVPAVALGLLDV
jgi:hypothetical protein